ncbi:hypothetical protein D3C76_1410690 [compost metagenome]
MIRRLAWPWDELNSTPVRAMRTLPRLMSLRPGCHGAAAAINVAVPAPSTLLSERSWNTGCSPARRTNSPLPKPSIGWISRHSNWSPSTFQAMFSMRVWKVSAPAGRLANRVNRAR